MYDFEPASAPPDALRNAYLDGLSEHQEYFLEELVGGARTWCLAERAYVVADDQQIVEFYVSPANEDEAAAIFDAAKTVTRAQRALCKSFDTQMLGPALAHTARVTATGILFRSFLDRPYAPRPNLTFQMAELSDVDAVIAFNDNGFFENRGEVLRFAQTQSLHLLKREGLIVGCGTQTLVNPGRPAVDLGMLVAHQERGKGYGSHIIAHMRQQVLEQDLVPVCGCAAHNHASHRALLNAGFRGDHRLLKIEFSAD